MSSWQCAAVDPKGSWAVTDEVSHLSVLMLVSDLMQRPELVEVQLLRTQLARPSQSEDAELAPNFSTSSPSRDLSTLKQPSAEHSDTMGHTLHGSWLSRQTSRLSVSSMA
jgi:hypothetical protein